MAHGFKNSVKYQKEYQTSAKIYEHRVEAKKTIALLANVSMVSNFKNSVKSQRENQYSIENYENSDYEKL